MPKKNSNISQSKALQESIKLMRFCPLCKNEFGEEAVRILEQNNAMNLLHITCPRCLGAMLALVLITNLGMSSVGVMTDLDADDVIKLYNKKSISEDDLFDFHYFVKSSGAIERAFSLPNKS